MIELINDNCMNVMAKYPDKHFDLAICDPPYGIVEKSNRKILAKGAATMRKVYNQSLWDCKKPNKEYFDELFRVSKNQIIWGGNYFTNHLPESRGWVVWDKVTADSNFADCELAWTSFDKSIRRYQFAWNGMIQGDMKNKEIRIHPTQKPVQLYRWLIQNYATQEDLILDTHLGSGSSAIAAHQMHFDFVGCEIDKNYYNDTMKRYNNAIMKKELF